MRSKNTTESQALITHHHLCHCQQLTPIGKPWPYPNKSSEPPFPSPSGPPTLWNQQNSNETILPFPTPCPEGDTVTSVGN